jgi:hypothetical protein
VSGINLSGDISRVAHEYRRCRISGLPSCRNSFYAVPVPATMPTEKTLVLIFGLFALPLFAADIYVATDGSDSGDGTLASPWASIQAAVDAATPGTTIHLRGGTYALSTNVQITETSGTSSQPITITAYNDESVIIDGEALTGYDPSRPRRL